MQCSIVRYFGARWKLNFQTHCFLRATGVFTRNWCFRACEYADTAEFSFRVDRVFQNVGCSGVAGAFLNLHLLVNKPRVSFALNAFVKQHPESQQ